MFLYCAYVVMDFAPYAIRRCRHIEGNEVLKVSRFTF